MRRRSKQSRQRKLKSDRRARHLCLRCDYHHVCRFIAGLDSNFRVVIAECAAFEPVRTGGEWGRADE